MVQNIIVFLIVLSAVVYMVRKIYNQLKGKGGCGCNCGCCSNCSSTKKLNEKTSDEKEKEGKTCSCCKKD